LRLLIHHLLFILNERQVASIESIPLFFCEPFLNQHPIFNYKVKFEEKHPY